MTLFSKFVLLLKENNSQQRVNHMAGMVNEIKSKLIEKGLKVTHQRLSILEAIYELNNHPTADQIIEHIRPSNPALATGTVYKVLDTLVENGLVARVKSDKDIMRYDADVDSQHHHVYCNDCDVIMDYESEDLDNMLKEFFSKNGIENFEIEGIKLQINGKFKNHQNIKQQ